MTNTSVTQRVGVDQVEPGGLKLANQARKKQKPIESEYDKTHIKHAHQAFGFQ